MRIVFRKDKTGEITAVYLNEVSNPYKYQLVCYAHLGQHGGCCIDWLYQDTKPATPKEYTSLLKELRDYHSDYDSVLLSVIKKLPRYSKTVKFLNFARKAAL